MLIEVDHQQNTDQSDRESPGMRRGVQPQREVDQQIAAAGEILARHKPIGGLLCTCGRTSPCSVVAAVSGRLDTYVNAKALLETTVVLQVIPTVEKGCPIRRRRTISDLITRLTDPLAVALRLKPGGRASP